MKIAIINGTIVNSDEKFKANILIENGKIAKIGSEKLMLIKSSTLQISSSCQDLSTCTCTFAILVKSIKTTSSQARRQRWLEE